MPMIPDDSPLRSLPLALPPAQAAFLDGLRLAAEIAELGMTRLEEGLGRLATMESREAAGGALFPAAFADVWSVLDAVNRFRELIRQLPGLKHDAAYRVFMDRTADIEEVRDVLQHLNSEIPSLAAANMTAWGGIDWVAVTDLSGGRARVGALMGGRHHSGIRVLLNPLTGSLTGPIDRIQLTLGDKTAKLSQAMRNVAAMIKGIQASLAEYPPGEPRSGSDLLVVIEVQFLPPSDASSEAS